MQAKEKMNLIDLKKIFLKTDKLIVFMINNRKFEGKN